MVSWQIITKDNVIIENLNKLYYRVLQEIKDGIKIQTLTNFLVLLMFQVFLHLRINITIVIFVIFYFYEKEQLKLLPFKGYMFQQYNDCTCNLVNVFYLSLFQTEWCMPTEVQCPLKGSC